MRDTHKFGPVELPLYRGHYTVTHFTLLSKSVYHQCKPQGSGDEFLEARAHGQHQVNQFYLAIIATPPLELACFIYKSYQEREIIECCLYNDLLRPNFNTHGKHMSVKSAF